MRKRSLLLFVLWYRQPSLRLSCAAVRDIFN